MVDRNYMSHGEARIDDRDLAEMELEMGRLLPWLPALLREVQYLRAEDTHAPRVEYLEGVLVKLGAEFDE